MLMNIQLQGRRRVRGQGVQCPPKTFLRHCDIAKDVETWNKLASWPLDVLSPGSVVARGGGG